MRKKWLIGIPLILIATYFLGPSPPTPQYGKVLPAVPQALPALETYVNLNEARHTVKPDNQARIVWFNDSLKEKTAYAIVYLHGFSASQGEGEPVHRNIARQFGCNLYLSRLAEHGIDTTEPLVNLTAENYWESAKEALAIGRQLGNKVIVMGTSTGATLALKLASVFPDIDALILLSPNIEINDPNAWLLNNHWGLQIARMVLGADYNYSKDQRAIYKKYWNAQYRIEGAVALQELLETSMTPSTFTIIRQPVLTLYYYKDNIHQDSVVKVSAMIDMMKQLGTPDNLKRSVAMPSAGDHVLGSYIKSKDTEGVLVAISKFLIEVLKLSWNPLSTLPEKTK